MKCKWCGEEHSDHPVFLTLEQYCELSELRKLRDRLVAAWGLGRIALHYQEDLDIIALAKKLQ